MVEITELDGMTGYGISRDGRVWSKRSRQAHGNCLPNSHERNSEWVDQLEETWREIKGGLNSTGYLTICICKNMKKSSYKIHRLVAETFISPIPKGMAVNHIDHNKLNNNVDNLEIVTYKENNQRYYEFKKLHPEKYKK